MLQFRKRVWFLVMLSVGSCVYKKHKDKLLERYIITCHTTDFECFKRQYKELRDHFLLGNERFGIPTYEHYVFEYGGGTCVKMTGIEDSELTSITMDSTSRRYTLVIDLPLRILQVKNIIKVCAKPQLEFTVIKPPQNPLMRFTGNVNPRSWACNSVEISGAQNNGQSRKISPSIIITYSYKLKKKRKVTFMYLKDESLDIALDIPDLSHFHMKSQVEARLYEWSEWAYEVVQHVDTTENFALPYTSQLGTLMEQLPLRRFILLYPDEQYFDLHFSLQEEKCSKD